MIICSCNVLSEHQVRCALAKATQMRMSQVYARLGSSAQCGRCAHTIREIMGSKSRSGELQALPNGRIVLAQSIVAGINVLYDQGLGGQVLTYP